MTDPRPVVPTVNPNEETHRRQLAERVNAAPTSADEVGRLLYKQTSAESSAGITPTNYQYEPGDYRRYTNDTPDASNEVTLTVGSGGTFSTITDALTLLSKSPTYIDDGVRVVLSLVSGFVMAEQVFVVGIDLSWIRITSVDAEVTITRSSLTETPADTNNAWTPAFYYGFGASGPVIDCLFSMDTSGTAANKSGLIIQGGRGFVKSGAGIKNAGERGLHCTQGFVRADSSIWTGAVAIGIRIANGSMAYLASADASDGTAIGLAVSDAFVSGVNFVADDCGTKNITINGGSHAALNSASALRGGTVGIEVLSGSVAYLTSANVTDSQTGLTVSASLVEADGLVASSITAEAVTASLGAVVNIDGANLSSAGTHAIRAETGSIVTCAGSANLSSATQNTVEAVTGARVYVPSGNLSGSGGSAVVCNRSYVDVANGNVGTATSTALSVLDGGEINATGVTIDALNDFSQPTNVRTQDGVIIYDSVSESATGTFTASLNVLTTSINSSGGAVTVTCPDGSFEGQRKVFTMSDASTSSTVSVTSHETSDPEVFTFAQTTDYLVLEWSAANAYWWTVKNIGAAV